MKIHKLLILIIIAIPSMLSAQQKNKYGMKIEKLTDGSYTIEKYSQISRIVDLTKTPDLYIPYKYIPDRIQKEDYEKCRTLKYIYKTYDNHSLSMEIDLPLNGTEPYPFIIYVHGGGWITGGSQAWKNQSEYIASKGIAGVRLTYTLNKNGGHFEQGIQEINDAFDFISNHASEWNLDMSRYGFAGGSAGSPLASYLTMKKNCKLFIGCNGIYDFTGSIQKGNFPGKNPYLRHIDSKEKKKAISVIRLVPTVDPPAVFVVHGTADITISYHQSVALSDSIAARGGKVVKLIYPYYVHSFYNKNVSDKYEEITIAMYRFAKDVFKM